jgi:hypothetical protein
VNAAYRSWIGMLPGQIVLKIKPPRINTYTSYLGAIVSVLERRCLLLSPDICCGLNLGGPAQLTMTVTAVSAMVAPLVPVTLTV